MSIELQIQSSVLGAMTARAIQARLWANCFAPIGATYIDHADVATAPVQFVALNAAVKLRVPVDVYVVGRADVLAAPNAVPKGTTVPAGTVIIVLEMATAGAVVSLRCVDAELGPLAAALGASAPTMRAAIIQSIGSPVKSDLTAALKQLGVSALSSSRVELVGSVVAIRFGSTGSAVGHLFPGHDWGLFLDGATVEELAKSKVPSGLESLFTSLALDAHWRPVGSTAHVDVDYAGNLALPDPFAGTANGSLGCDFSLVPAPLRGLRTTVHWSVHVHLDGITGFLDDVATAKAARAMNPAKFGGTEIDDHTFSIDSPLPDLSLGGARLGYTSVVASPAGMTIGGPVSLPADLGKDTLQPSVHQFGLPFRLTFCRTLAKSGSGAPSKTVSLDDVSTSGSVWLENSGVFGDYEIVSPGNWLSQFLKPPADNPEIRIVIPSASALAITKPVRLIVRTARGVRLVDLGTPPPVTFDANGNVSNAVRSHIPNCLYVRVDHGISWGVGTTELNPPLENPDWTTYLGRHRGIDVQLVSLSALEPGELIQFRSRDHAVDVTADRHGRALVPVMLPVANNLERATLIRVNRRGIAGHFSTQTALFVDQARLPAGSRHRWASSADGTAVLTTESANHIAVHEIGLLGSPIRLRHEEVALNPQPLPPREDLTLAHKPLFARRIDLPGMASLVAVPGFTQAPVALAKMADGATLVLDLGEDGTTRVAGTFIGPVGALEEAGNWAIAADPDRVSIFRLTRD